jgi:hypothetical protein
MRCAACGFDNPADTGPCQGCGEKLARKPRRATHSDLEDTWLSPPVNPPALVAYRLASVGLVPVLGLVAGPLAFMAGCAGLCRARCDPQARGRPYALTGVILGLTELLTNAGGLLLIYQGLTAS